MKIFNFIYIFTSNYCLSVTKETREETEEETVLRQLNLIFQTRNFLLNILNLIFHTTQHKYVKHYVKLSRYT